MLFYTPLLMALVDTAYIFREQLIKGGKLKNRCLTLSVTPSSSTSSTCTFILKYNATLFQILNALTKWHMKILCRYFHRCLLPATHSMSYSEGIKKIKGDK